jgi:hypothetical protein
MCFVFLMFLLAGLVDIAGLLDVHIAIVYAARQGARTGAVAGPISGADCAIIGAIHSSLLSQPNLTLNQIIIYQATSTVNGDYTGAQNAEIYPGTVDCENGQIINTQSGSVQSPTTNTFPATSRSITPFTEDSLGVQLVYSYQFRFNLLGSGSFSASDHAVCPMNPAGVPT